MPTPVDSTYGDMAYVSDGTMAEWRVNAISTVPYSHHHRNRTRHQDEFGGQLCPQGLRRVLAKSIFRAVVVNLGVTTSFLGVATQLWRKTYRNIWKTKWHILDWVIVLRYIAFTCDIISLRTDFIVCFWVGVCAHEVLMGDFQWARWREKSQYTSKIHSATSDKCPGANS